MSDEFGLVREPAVHHGNPGSAVLELVGGPVFAELAVLPLVDVDRVWEPLAQLHEAAVGGRARGAARRLGDADPFEAWSRATLGLQGYLRSISPQAAANVLDSASDYADFYGHLSGLDSVYLSAMASAGRDLDRTWSSLERAGALIDDVGIPSTPGGNAQGTLHTNAATGHAALVDHQSLKQQIEGAHGNPVAIVDILAREGLGLLATGSRSVVPGSGVYVQEIGGVVTATSEGVAWGASAGAAIGALGGAAGVVIGAGIGAVLGGLIGLVTSVIHAVSTLAGSDAAKGDKVPVSPPAPVTTDGHTTHVTKDGHPAAGGPVSHGGAAPHHPSPGPAAKQLHCPRGDDESDLVLDLAGWQSQFELMVTVAPTGPGFDALFAEAAAIALPPTAELSFTGEVLTTGLWGDLMIERAAPVRPGGIDHGRLVAVDEMLQRVLLARTLLERAGPHVPLARALRMSPPVGRAGRR